MVFQAANRDENRWNPLRSEKTSQQSEHSFYYDANGNITQITDASGTIQYRYEYDNLGQLKREDNRPQNKTFVYTYDNAGNRILYGR